MTKPKKTVRTASSRGASNEQNKKQIKIISFAINEIKLYTLVEFGQTSVADSFASATESAAESAAKIPATRSFEKKCEKN